MNHTQQADTDKEEFRGFCQYFTYRAEMLQSLDEELQGRPYQAAGNTSRGQSMGHGDDMLASEGAGSNIIAEGDEERVAERGEENEL